MYEDYSYLGSGIVLIRPWREESVAFEEIGNISAFSVTPQTGDITLANHRDMGGGVQNSVSRINDWQLSYTFHDFNPGNFARGTRGVETTIAAAAAKEATVIARKGRYVPLPHIANAIVSVAPAIGGAAFEAGTDYRLDRGMLFIPLDSEIDDEDELLVEFGHGELGRVEGAVRSQQFFELQFRGDNEARSGKKVLLACHKVAGGVIQELALIGDAHGAGTINGSLNADPAKRISEDHSAFFYWEQEK